MASVSRAAFGRILGVDRSRVTAWAASGMPVRDDGTIDPELAAVWVHRNVDPEARLRHARRSEQLRDSEAVEAARKLPCVGHLNEPSDVALVAALPMLAYAAPATIVAMSAACGIPLPSAFCLFRLAQVAVLPMATDMLDAFAVPPPPGCDGWRNAPLFRLDAFDQPNWQALAAQAGVPIDLPAWEAFSAARIREINEALPDEPSRSSGAEPDAARVIKEGKTK